MDESKYDLWYDATTVGADLVVETWVSHEPRQNDNIFDPQPGTWLLLGDDEERNTMILRVPNVDEPLRVGLG